MAKVTFIGLGVMGYPMAGHLAKRGGHQLTVFNRTTAKAEKWTTEYGGRFAPTPKAAAKALISSSLVLVMTMTCVRLLSGPQAPLRA